MSVLFEPDDEIDHIAEFADSGVRIFQRRGSLVGVPGSYGLKRYLYRRWRNNGNAIYTFVGSLIAIGLSGTWAYIVKQPLVFPSLGATAFLIFETPMAEVGSPRNTIIGHTVGILAGVVSLAIFGLLDAPSGARRVSSENWEVALQLPRGDLHPVVVPLLSLDLDVAVERVLAQRA
jgi:hypothetical protein